MYSFKEIVKYSDVDKNGYLPLYGVLAQFQNCINLHAKDIGQHYEVASKRGRAWVLISWKIKMYGSIKLYDHIEVGTWSFGFNKMFGDRAYVIYDKDGKELVVANTQWLLIDLQTRMPCRVNEEDMAGYATGEKTNLAPCVRKIALSEDKIKMEPVKVLKTYIDTNGHMNNTAYFRLAHEYMPEEFTYNTVDAVYLKETTQGMTLIPYVHKEENGIGISFEGEDNTVYTKIKFYTE